MSVEFKCFSQQMQSLSSWLHARQDFVIIPLTQPAISGYHRKTRSSRSRVPNHRPVGWRPETDATGVFRTNQPTVDLPLNDLRQLGMFSKAPSSVSTESPRRDQTQSVIHSDRKPHTNLKPQSTLKPHFIHQSAENTPEPQTTKIPKLVFDYSGCWLVT